MGKPILIDVDGVCASFNQLVLDFTNNRFGTNFSVEELGRDIREVLGKYWDNETQKFIESEGFAQMLDPIEESVEAVKKLIEYGENVLFVTSPFKTSATWGYDRTQWIKKYFDLPRDHIILTNNKAPVDGKTLIDDKIKNCVEWIEYPYHDREFSVLFRQPWNQEFDLSQTVGQVIHTNDWDEIFKVLGV